MWYIYNYIIILYIIFYKDVLGTVGTLGTGVFSITRTVSNCCLEYVYKYSERGVPTVPTVPSL